MSTCLGPAFQGLHMLIVRIWDGRYGPFGFKHLRDQISRQAFRPRSAGANHCGRTGQGEGRQGGIPCAQSLSLRC